VILWINGTFGAGKTTTGTLLAQRSPRLRLFDPEWVGYLLRNNLADHNFTDFQQLEPWRRPTPLVADELATFTGQSLVTEQYGNGQVDSEPVPGYRVAPWHQGTKAPRHQGTKAMVRRMHPVDLARRGVQT
jgi:hypothetical protein